MGVLDIGLTSVGCKGRQPALVSGYDPASHSLMFVLLPFIGGFPKLPSLLEVADLPKDRKDKIEKDRKEG